METRIRIMRLDGGSLVLDGEGLADAFFSTDPSSVGVGSYDAIAGFGARDRIETADLYALNRTMRARSAHSSWAPIIDVRLPWLARIDPALDLIETDEAQWEKVGGEGLVADALAAVVGPNRNLAVTTKMLHLKRPSLFPILDKLVVEMLGGGVSQDAPPEVRAARAAALVAHIRAEGRANLRALRAIQTQLAREDVARPVVRILDAIVWLAHPAVRSAAARIIECRVDDR
jgi:hypothetical protein